MRNLFTILILSLCLSAKAQFDFSCAPYMASIPSQVGGGGGGITFAFVQVKTNYSSPGNVISMTNTAGNTLVILESGSGFPVTNLQTIVDTKLNSYTQVGFADIGVTGRLFAWVAFNVAGGSNTITVTTTLGDKGMAAVEYSGPTSLDVGGNAVTPANVNSITNTTTGTDMLVSLWANENTDSFSSNIISGPLGNNGLTVRNFTTNHKDRELDYLGTAGAGFAAGTYTNVCTNTASSSGLLSIYLK